MKLAIVTPTYQREDGASPFYLTRTIESVKNQTHQKFKYYLIGDNYENNHEFYSFENQLTGIDYYVENLPVAIERERYPINSKKLWYCGGVNAYNYGVQKALNDGYEWVCHLDHDDYWTHDHLSTISSVIEQNPDAALVYTCANYLGMRHIPEVPLTSEVDYQVPKPTCTVHSTVCMNHKHITLKYRDVYFETGEALEADIDMWERLSIFFRDNEKLQSILVRKVTCFHDQEKNMSEILI